MEVDRGIKVGEDLKKEPQTHKQQACTLGLIAQVIFAFCNVLNGRSRRGHQFVSRLKKHSPRNYNRADRLVSKISHNAGGERRTVGVQHEDDHPQNKEMAQHHCWPAGYDAKKQPRKKHGHSPFNYSITKVTHQVLARSEEQNNNWRGPNRKGGTCRRKFEARDYRHREFSETSRPLAI